MFRMVQAYLIFFGISLNFGIYWHILKFEIGILWHFLKNSAQNAIYTWKYSGLPLVRRRRECAKVTS